VKITSTIIILLFFSVSCIYSQAWQQTAGTPEGGGVTDIVVREFNRHIFVATSSYNWPNGDMGGVRRSVDEGSTWENLWDVYITRTIIEGSDGNLYASIWPYPQSEGLYRSTDDGNTWGSPLVTVPTGDNIFSIALNPTTSVQTIFAGTRNGILRSLDNGATFSQANNGIPLNSWVNDIEVDSSGIVATATTNGVFVSINNGDSWMQTTGIEDTISELYFDYPLTSDNLQNDAKLIAGSNNGKLKEASENEDYLAFTLIALLEPNEEIAALWAGKLWDLNLKKHGVATYPRNNNSGGYYESNNDGQTWEKHNEGLPQNPKTSALDGEIIPTRQTTLVNEFIGLFENTNGGARIFKRETIVSIAGQNSGIPDKYYLSQNYPNPFNPTTTISFSIPNTSRITLEIYNSLGEKVSTLVSKTLPASTYRYEWDSEGLASGIYFYKMVADNFTEIRKMILLK